MRRSLVIVALIVSIAFFYNSVNAENSNGHDTVGMEQAMDHLLLSQFREQINTAVKDYYKEESITIQFDWYDKNYDVVEVTQSEKGQQLSHPFLVKFTVLSYGAKEKLGTDTMTFGVSFPVADAEVNDANLAAMKSELVDFKHNED